MDEKTTIDLASAAKLGVTLRPDGTERLVVRYSWARDNAPPDAVTTLKRFMFADTLFDAKLDDRVFRDLKVQQLDETAVIDRGVWELMAHLEHPDEKP